MNIIGKSVSFVLCAALVAAAAPIALVLLALGAGDEAPLPQDEHQVALVARAQRSPVG